MVKQQVPEPLTRAGQTTNQCKSVILPGLANIFPISHVVHTIFSNFFHLQANLCVRSECLLHLYWFRFCSAEIDDWDFDSDRPVCVCVRMFPLRRIRQVHGKQARYAQIPNALQRIEVTARRMKWRTNEKQWHTWTVTEHRAFLSFFLLFRYLKPGSRFECMGKAHTYTSGDWRIDRP